MLLALNSTFGLAVLANRGIPLVTIYLTLMNQISIQGELHTRHCRKLLG